MVLQEVCGTSETRGNTEYRAGDGDPVNHILSSPPRPRNAGPITEPGVVHLMNDDQQDSQRTPNVPSILRQPQSVDHALELTQSNLQLADADVGYTASDQLEEMFFVRHFSENIAPWYVFCIAYLRSVLMLQA